MLRVAEEDYLKLVYKLGLGGKKVALRDVAQGLQVSPPAVTKMVRKLREKGLVSFDRSSGAQLTESGRKVALTVVRGHRLIEVFLHEYLDYDWDEVHEEAELLEHAVSDRFKERLARVLGYPTHDPHGEPIPDTNLKLNNQHEFSLLKAATGEAVFISSVRDNDSKALQKFASLNLYPGQEITPLSRGGDGSLELENAAGRIRLADKYIRMINVRKKVEENEIA